VFTTGPTTHTIDYKRTITLYTRQQKHTIYETEEYAARVKEYCRTESCTCED